MLSKPLSVFVPLHRLVFQVFLFLLLEILFLNNCQVAHAFLIKSEIMVWRAEEGGNNHGYQIVRNCESRRSGCFSPLDLVKWDEARDLATESGGYLATITSVEESDFVNLFVDSTFFGRVGSLLVPSTDNWWVGGYQTPDTLDPTADWNWITGEPFEFTNWGPGEPNDFSGVNEQFLHLSRSSIFPTDLIAWNDEGNIANLGIYAFVIEFDTVPEPSTACLMIFACLSHANRWRG